MPMAALAVEDYFDSVSDIDIIVSKRWQPTASNFATNFDPEINFREFTAPSWSWQNSPVGQQQHVRGQTDATTCQWVGAQTSYMNWP